MTMQGDQLHIPMHKRIAMGEKLDGTSLQPKGQQTQQKSQGGLAKAAKSK
jgi:hypothetical protein